MHDRSSVSLEILTDCLIRFPQKSRAVGGFDLGGVRRKWKRVPMQEIAAAADAVERDLISPKDQAGAGVSGVANAGEIAPCAGGIACVHADAVTVDAARRLAHRFLARSATHIAQDELVGRERD